MKGSRLVLLGCVCVGLYWLGIGTNATLALGFASFFAHMVGCAADVAAMLRRLNK